jgi:hypothetical protein
MAENLIIGAIIAIRRFSDSPGDREQLLDRGFAADPPLAVDALADGEHDRDGDFHR